jgi:Kef-type K+ transport system membrane component KefB
VIGVDSYAFLSIVSVAALAALVTAVAARRGFVIPVVALEVVLGVIIGPHVLDWAHVDDFTDFFAALGLGMLFFFAGYEVDFGRIQGRPVRLGGLGWLMSLALAFSIGGVLHVLGIVRSDLYAGSALTTTAIGTLIPILSDAKEIQTRFGTYLLAAGAFAEFGPILLVTLVLSATSPLHNALLLIAFVALAVLVAILSVRTFHHTWSLWVLTLESSGQLAVRMVVVLVFLLGLAASELGLDLLLGGFAAGMIVRLLLRGREVETFESKLVGLAYGFLVPFLFITSGMKLDVVTLAEDGTAQRKVPLFLALMLVVRGLPALLLYKNVLGLKDRLALGVFCATQLPLVVAITTIATEEGHMRKDTAAALVTAAVLSTLIFPVIGLFLRRSTRPVGEALPAPA